MRVIRPAPWAHGAGEVWIAHINDDTGIVRRAAAAVSVDASLENGATRVRGTRGELKRLAGALDAGRAPIATALWNALEPRTTWWTARGEIPVDRPVIMGIVNLTEDSFSGDGVGSDVAAALRRANELREQGADIIDVGGETARADRPVREAEDEAVAVARVVAALAAEEHVVSIDTYKPAVAARALEAGAWIVNDISGLTLGRETPEVAARAGAGYVLNYSYSVPKQRPDAPPVYDDVVTETVGWMFERVAQLNDAGLPRASIVVDPGIAFGKSHDEDLQVLRRIGECMSLGLPLLLAHSRKNYLGSVAGRIPGERDLETHISTVLALAQGARLFRVHDVEGTRRALDIAWATLAGSAGDYAPDAESWPWRAAASATHMMRGEADKSAPKGQRW
ncbi:MAG: dihydropteroate synthase [Dehalococcoidia bacterium]